MSQADSEPITGESFAAFATFLGTPLPENPIRALRILRKEAAAEIERLILFLDALGGDPDLEPGGDDEPALGWTGAEGGSGRYGALHDGEEEPSLGWTSALNQTSRRNRLGACDDAEDEHDGREPDVDDEDGGDMEGGGIPNPEYYARLKARRGPRKPLRRFIVSPEGVVHELRTVE
jgi:hypothetical protein